MRNYISKKTIRRWLDNYESLVVGDISFDEVPGNSGPSEYDGVYSGQLNKVMLEHAVEKLPFKEKTCCKNRWYFKTPVRHTANTLGITVDQYYRLCNKAINLIYRELNGEMIGVKKLLKRVRN